MGVPGGSAGTVEGEMSEPTEPERSDQAPSSPLAGGAGPRRRGLLGLPPRTLAICVCVALIGALAAGLVSSVVIGDDPEPTSSGATLEPAGRVDVDRLLAVAMETTAGKATTLAALLDGRPTVVNIWAQSCAPCVREMPLLEEASKANPDVAFVGVDTQDQLDAAQAMARKTGITYPWVQDPSGNFFYEAKGAGMPTTLLLDRSGNVLASKTAAFSSLAQLQGWIDGHRS